MKRKAYIGLSTPIGYNYKFETATTKPNPILDSPWGLFLFYDEIWFLDKGLCPINCQGLPYVHFLNQEYNLATIGLDDFYQSVKENKDSRHEMILSKGDLSLYEIIETNLDNSEFIDNHGRGLKIGNTGFSFNSTVSNLVIDDFIAEYFGLELITNTYINQFLSSGIDSHLRTALAQSVLVDNIPNIQLPEGPYHPVLEDLRSEDLLAYYRIKISEVLKNTSNDSIDVLKESLNNQMNIYKDELVVKAVSKQRIYKSALDATTAQIPIISNLYSGVDFVRNALSFTEERKNNGWVGFTVKAQSMISNRQ